MPHASSFQKRTEYLELSSTPVNIHWISSSICGQLSSGSPTPQRVHFPQAIRCLLKWGMLLTCSVSLNKYKLEQEQNLVPKEGNDETGEAFSLPHSTKAEQIWEVSFLLEVSIPEVLCKVNAQVQILSSRGRKLFCSFNIHAEWF